MRSILPALALLLACCSGPPSSSPSTAPTPEPAVPLEDRPAPAAAPTVDPAADPKPAAEDDNAGFADPKTATDEPPPAPQPPADPALAARIKERFGERCKHERSCGDLLGVDCQSATDGPYYYVQRSDLRTVATCGGACMGGRCTDCPPKAWTCPTY